MIALPLIFCLNVSKTIDTNQLCELWPSLIKYTLVSALVTQRCPSVDLRDQHLLWGVPCYRAALHRVLRVLRAGLFSASWGGLYFIVLHSTLYSDMLYCIVVLCIILFSQVSPRQDNANSRQYLDNIMETVHRQLKTCLLYTSDAADE